MKSYMLTLIIALLFVFGQAALAAEKESAKENDKNSAKEIAEKSTETKDVQADKIEDKVMVTVNDKPIMQSTVDERIAPQLETAKKMGQTPSEEVLNNFRKRVLQGMIRETLISNAIEAKKIKITDKNVDAKLKEIAEQQGTSVEELISTAKERGYTEDKIREQVKMGLGFDALMEAEAGKDALKVTEDDAKKYYDDNIDRYSSPDEVKVSHILAGGRGFDSFDEEKKAEAKAKIEEVQKKLKEGMSFEEAAQQYSDCPSKKDGGDLKSYISKEGKINGRPAMDPTFSAAAHTMKVGEYGDIVKTPFGYHIIKCTDKKKAEVKTFDDVKESILNQLKDQKKGEFAQGYIEKLVADAKIVYPEEEKKEAKEVADKIEIKPAAKEDKK